MSEQAQDTVNTQTPPQTFNEADVRRFWRLVACNPTNEWVELRMFKPNTPGSKPEKRLFTRHEDEFVETCRLFNGQLEIYAGINPRVQDAKKKGKGDAEHVARVICIPIDIDADHPIGKDMKWATPETLAEAEKDRDKVLAWADGAGFDKPYVDYSGNGWHIIFKVDIPADAKRVKALTDSLYKTLKIKCDEKVKDIPRVLRVAGTLNNKDYPPKLSRVIHFGRDHADTTFQRYYEGLKTHMEKTKAEPTEENPAQQQTAEQKVERGSRHDTIIQRGRELRELGWGYESMFEALLDWDLKENAEPIQFEVGRGIDEIKRAADWCFAHIDVKKFGEPEDYFSKKDDGKISKFQPKRLADAITTNYLFVAPYGDRQRGKTSRIYRYHADTGCWRPDGEELIHSVAARSLGKLFKDNHTNEVEKYIRKTHFKHHDDWTEADINLIGMKNGVYNIATGELLPFSPEHYLRQSIPVTYDPKATCPGITQFINEVSPGYLEDQFEIIGYCLYRDYVIAVIVIYEGSGKNGKSTLLDLIRTFLGPENVANNDLQDFAEDRFVSSTLYEKYANLSGDIPSNPIKKSGPLKNLCGGDAVAAQFKNQDRFNFKNYAKLISSCNKVPPSYDDSDAWFRRPMIIPFPNQFSRGDGKCDLNILDKITSPQELSGLFNEAIKALKRLLKNQRFTHEPTDEEKRRQYVKKSSTAQYFIEEFIEPNVGVVGYIEKNQVYREYVQWCRNTVGSRPASSQKFSTIFKIYAPGWDEGRVNVPKPKVKGQDQKYTSVRVWNYVRLNKAKLAEAGGAHTP